MLLSHTAKDFTWEKVMSIGSSRKIDEKLQKAESDLFCNK